MLIENKFFVDDRGTFCDLKGDFGFDIKRVYVCENFSKNTIRGFHYHLYEAKLFYVPQGAVKFVLWSLPPEKAKRLQTLAWNDTHCTSIIKELLEEFPPSLHVISAATHQTIYIPPKYANAWKPLEENTILIGCSNRTLKQSVNDDLRIDPNHKQFKHFWEVQNR